MYLSQRTYLLLQENIFCPGYYTAKFDSGTSVNVTLGDYRSIRTVLDGDTSSDIRDYGKLARYVCHIIYYTGL